MSRTQGFTLLELLVVIVVLIMAISVATISIVSGQDGARMKTSAGQLVSVLRSSRTRAITESIEVGITLGVLSLDDDSALNSSGLESYDSGRPGFKQRRFKERGFEGEGFELQGAYSAYTIIPAGDQVILPEPLLLTLTSTVDQGIVAPNTVLFYPDGSASGARLVLSMPSGKMTIDVDWLTGEIVLDGGPVRRMSQQVATQ